MKKFLLIASIVFGLILAGCSSNSWTGFYYPDASNIGDQTTWKTKEGLKSLEECRDWVDSIKGDNKNYDYECGYSCEYNIEYGMNVCEKTEE